jgi:hypothetical protein
VTKVSCPAHAKEEVAQCAVVDAVCSVDFSEEEETGKIKNKYVTTTTNV